MRRVCAEDLDRVGAMMGQAPHLAMFPLSNLARHGLEGEHDRAPFMWVEGDGVLTITREGMVMPFFPDGEIGAAPRVMAGRKVIGVIGEAVAARCLMASCGLEGRPALLDRDEPQFLLDLDQMVMPAGDGTLIPLQDAPRSLMEDWRVAYDVEALGSSPDAARARIGAVVEGYIAADSHRVLMVDGEPVCTTGFNAALPEIVQIGGVYTPPELRGRGYARLAVALHLAQAQAEGVGQGTLFASGAAAVRAYEAIGFKHVGAWTLALFKGAEVVDG